MVNVFYILLGLVSIIYVFKKVKKRLFSEKESFFWMLGAIIVLILSIFPNLIDTMSTFIGIQYPPSFLFLLSILFITLIVFRLSMQISVLNEKVKELAQRNAILDEELRKKESEKELQYNL